MDFMLALSGWIRAAYVGRVMEACPARLSAASTESGRHSAEAGRPLTRVNRGRGFRQCSMGDAAVAAAARRNHEIPHVGALLKAVV